MLNNTSPASTVVRPFWKRANDAEVVSAAALADNDVITQRQRGRVFHPVQSFRRVAGNNVAPLVVARGRYVL